MASLWDYPVTLTGLALGALGYCIPPVYAAATSFVAANPVTLFVAGSVSLLVYADLNWRSKPEESVLRSMFSKQESPVSGDEKSDSQGTAADVYDKLKTTTTILKEENDVKEQVIQSLRRSNEALKVGLESGAQVDGMEAYINRAVQKATQEAVKRELEMMQSGNGAAAGVAPGQ